MALPSMRVGDVEVQGISDGVLESHFKLYEGYVNRTNKLTDSLMALTKEGQAAGTNPAGPKPSIGHQTACPASCAQVGSGSKRKPYEAVDQILIGAVSKQSFVTLKVTPGLEKQLVASTGKKLMRAANHAVGVDGIVINPSGLQVDSPTLFEVCNAYRAAAGGRSL